MDRPLLDLSITPGDLSLVTVKQFTNRIVHCINSSNQQLVVYYPGASKHMPKPLKPYMVLVKAYEKPRARCTHYLVAGDARIHSWIDQASQKWTGFTTLFNNLLFKQVLDQNRWVVRVNTYRQQVKLKNSRIDFLLEHSHYLEVKADFVMWFPIKKSRFLTHLLTLNSLTLRSTIVFIAPYATSLSVLHNPRYTEALQFLKTFSNVSFYWLYVTYDKEGKVWFNSLKQLNHK